jgi:hypothetical protein
MLDMSVFTAQNEKVRAVGNMGVNARGDKIDSAGKVVQSVNDKINEYYSQTVDNPGSTAAIPTPPGLASRAIEASQKPVAPKSQIQADPVPSKPAPEELTDIERDLEESLEEDIPTTQQSEK